MDGNIHKLKAENKDAIESDEDQYGDPKIFEQPHSYLRDNEINENDIYTQEFFLHCYSLLS